MAGASGWDEVASLLRAQRRLAGLSLRSLARLTNVSDSYLSQVERGLYQPSPEVLKSIAGALGVSPTGLYERLGWLDAGEQEPVDRGGETAAPPEDVPDVERALAADTRLTDAQRSALLATYRALVGET